MKSLKKCQFVITAVLFFIVLIQGNFAGLKGQNLDEWKYKGCLDPEKNFIITEGQFNGYLNYWTNDYWKWIQYGNLFLISLPNPEYCIVQNKLDMGEEMGITGFWMEEGFLNGLLTEEWRELENPSLQEVLNLADQGSLLLYIDSRSKLGLELESKLPQSDKWKEKLQSNQYYSQEYKSVKAFYLEKGKNKLFVVSSESIKRRKRAKKLIEDVQTLITKYDLHRGWPGVQTRYYSVTCWPGHPLEIIGKAMNQGNDWLTFCGYMDYRLKKDLDDWLKKVDLPFITDVGTGRATHGLGTIIYGCNNYDGIKPQDTPSLKEWIQFAREHGGFIFRPVYGKELGDYHFDGYVGGLGNKEQIDNENVPFMIASGHVKEKAPPCMILFVEKGVPLTKDRLYEAIFKRRNVAVMERGQMMGEKLYRNALQMLLMDRVFLEEYFRDRIQIKAEVKDRELIVTLANTYPSSVSGKLKISLPAELVSKDPLSSEVNLPAQASKIMTFSIKPTLLAMDRDNPIGVYFEWGGKKKATLTVMSLPRVISVHQLLYGHAPKVNFPVTIHNFTEKDRFPMIIQVFKENNSKTPLFESSRECHTKPGEFKTLKFDLEVPAGRYEVKVSALGTENISQLAVGESTANPYLDEVDLNGDGINEYRMENDKVKVTLLRIGARVIEYRIKKNNDNIFFKLWPEKDESDRRPFRKRGFYPYGGFEDFLGQASLETHRVYDVEVLRKEGDFVRVRMTANYYGNKLEKVFTLYGNKPLLEVRFALTFKNEETNMLGPQPMLELGEKHWTEDKFLVPTYDGIQEFRMRPEEYFGRVLYLKEGWNVGYDTKEDITFIGTFPVSEPEFLHLWMNHPINKDSHHYYAELQPWVPIFRNSIMYFSYYLWGAEGPWEDGLKTMRKIGLITQRQKPGNVIN